jgi:outer membrane murein-binding lipoprotein Lpp
MYRIRESAIGAVVLCLVLLGGVPSQAQAQGIPARVDALQAQLDQALATIAQLKTALKAEADARKAADATLQGNIDVMSGGGVTQAAVDAAVGAEAAARMAADTLLQGNISTEAAQRAAFDATLASVSALAPYVTVDTGTINDLAGPHVIFSGVNLHVRSGHPSGNSYTENGRGNLVVGYNEPSDSSFPAERGGSHNVVVGPNHRYNFGVGLIVGGSSRLGNDGASVSGGFMNTASGLFATAGAGLRNEASGDFASVSGGADNVASANASAVSAGQLNQATGDLSSVSGGFNNVSSGAFSAVGGGSSLVNAIGFTFIP